jgi:hypothetical protein
MNSADTAALIVLFATVVSVLVLVWDWDDWGDP